MSTMAVLVAAVFWTWLWGPIGLLMATPLSVCIVVMGKYVPQLQFLDVLLGDRPVLEAHQRLFQRLLAGDQEEATELAEKYLDEHALEETYDQMVLPALAMAEQGRHSGRLEDRHGFGMRRTLRELVDELVEQERIKVIKHAADETLRQVTNPTDAVPANGAAESPAKAEEQTRPRRVKLPSGCQINVLVLPAHDEADEIAGIMLSHLLDLRGYQVRTLSENVLASEMIEQVQKAEAQIVCVSALPPAAVAHARYLCKRLFAKFPDLNAMIGLWMMDTTDQKKAQRRLACMVEPAISTTLAQALDQIAEIAQPLISKATLLEKPVAAGA
jgi:hypothetical protein